MFRLVGLLLRSAAFLLLIATGAEAQRDTAVPIQFDFISPGARSLALGGAFTGVADDATAAATNPAGLIQLSRREASLEGRSWRYVTPFVQAGRVSGNVRNNGIDTIAGADIGETERTVVGPSFVSYVHPLSVGPRPVNLAAYRQEVSRLRAQARTQGFFFLREGDPADHRELPFQVDRQIDVVSYGLSFGAALPGHLSIGAGVQASNLAIFSLLRGYEYPEPGGVRDLYAPADYRELLYEGHQIADDWSASFNAGAMWILPSRQLQIGASYRGGPAFNFDGSFRYPDRLGRPGQEGTNSDYRGKFRVPDTMAVGVGVRPMRDLRLLLSAEFTRVRYSELLDFIRDSIVFTSADPSRYEIRDSNEWHAGAEYLFSGPKSPKVRVGVWRDPDHALTYGGSDPVWRVLPPGESLIHVSFGGGIELSEDVRLDGGADISKRPVVIAISAILMF